MFLSCQGCSLLDPITFSRPEFGNGDGLDNSLSEGPAACSKRAIGKVGTGISALGSPQQGSSSVLTIEKYRRRISWQGPRAQGEGKWMNQYC